MLFTFSLQEFTGARELCVAHRNILERLGSLVAQALRSFRRHAPRDDKSEDHARHTTENADHRGAPFTTLTTP